MALWTDIIDPASLTGYARAALADYEARRGSLARWLPNRDVADIVVRFVKGQTGLQDVANFRAYDAEIEVGKRPSGQRVTLELPALGQNLPVSEYEQLRARGGNVSDAAALITIQNVTRMAVQAVSDRMELLRGTVLTTGKATVTGNFVMDDDFGRAAGLTLTAPALWSVAGTDRLTQLQTWSDLYLDTNGEAPGSIVMSTRALRALAAGTQFQTQLLNGGARPATEQEVRDLVLAAGLPPIYLYDRRVSVNGTATKAVADDRVLMLPAPVAEDDWMGTQLGATFWGRTLSSLEAGWGIAEADQPGVVAGVYRNAKPPMGIEVLSDAIGEPVLANANLSLCADVL
jgi:hypothetical protein